MNDLLKRILKISYENGLAHIGSCISVLPILLEIYNKKKPEDLVILTAAHSHLAHLIVKGYDDIEIKRLIKKYGIHCDRQAGCDASGGSLGHLGIGVGMAIANPNITIWAITTDGSSNEGSELEAMRIKTALKLDNLKIIVNMNGYVAVEKINRDLLSSRLRAFCPDIDIRYTDFYGIKALDGINAHYKILNKEEYEQSVKDIVEREYMENSGV